MVDFGHETSATSKQRTEPCSTTMTHATGTYLYHLPLPTSRGAPGTACDTR